MKIVKTALLAIGLISVGTVTPGFIDILDGAATFGIVAGSLVAPLTITLQNPQKFEDNVIIGGIASCTIILISSASKAAIYYYKHLENQDKVLETQEKSLETHNKILEALEANTRTNQKILEQLTEKKETEQTT